MHQTLMPIAGSIRITKFHQKHTSHRVLPCDGESDKRRWCKREWCLHTHITVHRENKILTRYWRIFWIRYWHIFMWKLLTLVNFPILLSVWQYFCYLKSVSTIFANIDLLWFLKQMFIFLVDYEQHFVFSVHCDMGVKTPFLKWRVRIWRLNHNWPCLLVL